jgi:DNA-binding MarR family transcriptional regulator
MTIVAHLQKSPLTVSQLGERLGVHPANLTRHVRRLEDAGLIERLPHGGGVEKHYRATADGFEIAPDHTAHGAAHTIALSMARSDIGAALQRLSDNDTRPADAFLARATLSPTTAVAFLEEMRALAERFRATASEDGEAFHLNLSLYPGGDWDGPSGRIELNRQTNNDKGE